MESPVLTLSRSPSSSSFAPGSHRRSHPNLQQQAHLSFAPLTPKYPIDPADYSAYFEPGTSDLHTSASISHISALPSPGGILTNSPARSRANSRTRLKRKAKSNVTLVLPDSSNENTTQGSNLPSGALTSHGFGGHISTNHILKATQPRSLHSSGLHLHNTLQSDSSWLVQTGLALTESSRENKGQSWISKRDSSTSLASLHTANEIPNRSRSGRTTPSRSRAGSRSRRSRRELAMTPAGFSSQLTTSSAPLSPDPADSIVPDWADASTRAEATASSSTHSSTDTHSPSQLQTAAEIAAALSSELADEDDLDDGDPYGVLNFDDHFEPFDSEDEAEMRRELARHRTGLGRWFDGVVDVFLNLEEEFPDLDGDGDGDGDVRGERRSRDERRGRGGMDGLRALEEGAKREEGAVEDAQTKQQKVEEMFQEGEVETPPEEYQGVWGDVKWFGRLVARIVRS